MLNYFIELVEEDEKAEEDIEAFLVQLALYSWVESTPKKYKATFEEAIRYFSIFGYDIYWYKFIYVRTAIERLGEENIRWALVSTRKDVSSWRLLRTFLLITMGGRSTPIYDPKIISNILDLFVQENVSFSKTKMFNIYKLFKAGKNSWCPTIEDAYALVAFCYEAYPKLCSHLFHHALTTHPDTMLLWTGAGFSPQEAFRWWGAGWPYSEWRTAVAARNSYKDLGYSIEKIVQSVSLLKGLAGELAKEAGLELIQL